MSHPALSPTRRRWIRSGDPTHEAAWLAQRVQAGGLPRERLCLAAHLGHPAARLAATRLGLALPSRHAQRAGAGAGLRQWILGLGDACAPAERVTIARRTLAVLLHALDHDHDSAALDEHLSGEKPWSVLRTVAGWAQDALDELEDPERVRRRVRVALLAWALAPGQAAREHDPRAWYRVGERVESGQGVGVVRRAGKAWVEVEEKGQTWRLPHRRSAP